MGQTAQSNISVMIVLFYKEMAVKSVRKNVGSVEESCFLCISIV